MDEQDRAVRVVKEQGVDYSATGEAIPWTDVYVKIKVAFRQKALKLLKGPKLSCFLCVALHVGDDGTSYPSIDTIVRETGYSRPAVCSALAELETLGFIEKMRRKQQTNIYRIKGYAWYGSESKPTLLGESNSKSSLLQGPSSKPSERSPSKRSLGLPKDNPSSKDKPSDKENIAPAAKNSPSAETKKAQPNTIEAIVEQSKTHPDQFDLGRRTEEKQTQIGGNYADPVQAGGADRVTDTALFALYSFRGKKPPRKDTKEWGRQLFRVSETLKAYGYEKATVKLVEKAAEILCNRKGDWTNVFYPSFPMDFGQALSDAEHFLEHGRLPDNGNRQKGAKQHGSHQHSRKNNIAPGAARRRVATEEEARAILG